MTIDHEKLIRDLDNMPIAPPRFTKSDVVTTMRQACDLLKLEQEKEDILALQEYVSDAMRYLHEEI